MRHRSLKGTRIVSRREGDEVATHVSSRGHPSHFKRAQSIGLLIQAACFIPAPDIPMRAVQICNMSSARRTAHPRHTLSSILFGVYDNGTGIPYILYNALFSLMPAQDARCTHRPPRTWVQAVQPFILSYRVAISKFKIYSICSFYFSFSWYSCLVLLGLLTVV